MRIGVLALQGAFIEHERMLRELGADCFEIRQLRDISGQIDGIVIPGGESRSEERRVGKECRSRWSPYH